jgi:hypothetical protein
LEDLFVIEFKDLLSIEKQLINGPPKMAGHAR